MAFDVHEATTQKADFMSHGAVPKESVTVQSDRYSFLKGTGAIPKGRQIDTITLLPEFDEMIGPDSLGFAFGKQYAYSIVFAAVRFKDCARKRKIPARGRRIRKRRRGKTGSKPSA